MKKEAGSIEREKRVITEVRRVENTIATREKNGIVRVKKKGWMKTEIIAVGGTSCRGEVQICKIARFIIDKKGIRT